MDSIYGKSTQGGRDYQEDYFSTVHQEDSDPRSDILIVLADGMGGHAAGDVASKTAVRSFEASFLSSTSKSPKHRLSNALFAADRAIADRIAEDSSLTGMGCTLIGALKLHNRVIWISVGDSHVFLFRDGKLRKVNADHSMMGELMEMVKKGSMTLEEARAHPRRNALRSALIGTTPPLIDERSVALVEGDILLLASDGIDTIAMDELQDIVVTNKSRPPEVLTQAILKRIDDIGKPNQDNTTVISCYHTQSARPTWSESSRWTLGEEGKSGPAGKNGLMAGLLALAVVLIGGLLALLFWPAPEPAVETTPIETRVPSESESEISGSRDGGIDDGSGVGEDGAIVEEPETIDPDSTAPIDPVSPDIPDAQGGAAEEGQGIDPADGEASSSDDGGPEQDVPAAPASEIGQ